MKVPPLDPIARRAVAQDYEQLLDRALEEQTYKAYMQCWREFVDYCLTRGQYYLPARPVTVALYLKDLARTFKAETIRKRLAAIRYVHVRSYFPSPTETTLVRQVMKGINRACSARTNVKRGLERDDLKSIVDKMEQDALAPANSPSGRRRRLGALRDRLMMTLGYVHALTREELRQLNIEQCTTSGSDLIVTGLRERPVQFKRGRFLDPARYFIEWRQEVGQWYGPLLRGVASDGTISMSRYSAVQIHERVKEWCRRAGLNERFYAVDSLRKGFRAAAAEHGIPLPEIARICNLKNVDRLKNEYRKTPGWRSPMEGPYVPFSLHPHPRRPRAYWRGLSSERNSEGL